MIPPLATCLLLKSGYKLGFSALSGKINGQRVFLPDPYQALLQKQNLYTG